MRIFLRKLLRILISLAVYVMIAGRGIYTYADEKEEKQRPPEIKITAYGGETILAMEGCPIYSSVPVTFTADAADGECFYSTRMEDEEEFGECLLMEGGDLTLYPDDQKNPCGRWDIRFMWRRCVCADDEKTDDDDTGEEAGDAEETDTGEEAGDLISFSPVYSVSFDTTAPGVEAADEGVFAGWFAKDTGIDFNISDDKSGVGRVIMKCNDKVVKEIHPGEAEGLATGGDKVSFPVTDTGKTENTGLIECYDLAGNSSSISFEYRFDKTEPRISLEGPEDGSCHKDGAWLSIEGSDTETGVFVNYAVDRQSGEEVYSYEVTGVEDKARISFDDDGEYRVRAWAVDEAGNSSEEVSLCFAIDATPPAVSIEGVSDNVDLKSEAELTIDISENIHKNGQVNITLSRTAYGKTELISDESYELSARHETRKVNISSDGQYELTVRVTDGAGNAADVTRSFRIDKTPPDISVSGVGEGEVTNDKPVLCFGAGEMFYESTVLSTILEKKEKGGYVPVEARDRVMTSPQDHIDVETPGEGRYRLTCIAADRSGNTASRSVDYTVDYTPPVIADLSDMDRKFFRSFSLPVKAASLVSDATRVSVDAYLNDDRINDDDVIIEEGKYVLNILAEDEAGNVSDDQATFIVDHTAPQIVLAGCDREGNVKKGSLLTVGLLEDGDTLKSVKFNGRSIVIGSDNKADIVVDDYGEYTIAVVAEDEAGNVTDTEIHTSCYMIGKTVDDYLKGGKTIMLTGGQKDKDDVDLAGLFIGLASVVGGTLGLSYCALFRNEP